MRKNLEMFAGSHFGRPIRLFKRLSKRHQHAAAESFLPLYVCCWVMVLYVFHVSRLNNVCCVAVSQPNELLKQQLMYKGAESFAAACWCPTPSLPFLCGFVVPSFLVVRCSDEIKIHGLSSEENQRRWRIFMPFSLSLSLSPSSVEYSVSFSLGPENWHVLARKYPRLDTVKPIRSALHSWYSRATKWEAFRLDPFPLCQAVPFLPLSVKYTP